MFVISTAEMGGAQRVTVHLTDWIMEHTDAAVRIVALSRGRRETYDMERFDFVALSGGRSFLPLRREVQRFTPDVLVTMGVPLAVYTIPATFLTKTKNIVSERNDPEHFAGKTFTRILSRFLMRFAAGYVFQTAQARDFYWRLLKKPYAIIANPLFRPANFPETAFAGERRKEIVSVGRLNKQKNQMLLLEAFAAFSKKHGDYRLVIWGDGPERERLQEFIDDGGIRGAVLAGTTKDVCGEISGASMFVLSSDFEGMPNALIEAMALGLPCISTDCPCGGPRELIRDGENGLLVPVGDRDALLAAMERLSDDGETARRLGEHAFEIREKLDCSLVCGQWFSFFSEAEKR